MHIVCLGGNTFGSLELSGALKPSTSLSQDEEMATIVQISKNLEKRFKFFK